MHIEDSNGESSKFNYAPFSRGWCAAESRKLCLEVFKSYELKTWTNPLVYTPSQTVYINKRDKIQIGKRAEKQTIAIDMTCSLSSKTYCKGYKSLVLFIRSSTYSSDLTIDINKLKAVLPEFKFRTSSNNRLFVKMKGNSTPVDLAKAAWELAKLIDSRTSEIEAAFADAD